MSAHGPPCDEKDSLYCFNGATCYKVSPMDNTLYCVCQENYKGSRCEYLNLPSSTKSAYDAGLIAAVAVIAVLVLVALVVVIYYIQKMVKTSKRSKTHSRQQYKYEIPAV